MSNIFQKLKLTLMQSNKLAIKNVRRRANKLSVKSCKIIQKNLLSSEARGGCIKQIFSLETALQTLHIIPNISLFNFLINNA